MKFYEPFRNPEEIGKIPKQKPLHYVTGYNLGAMKTQYTKPCLTCQGIRERVCKAGSFSFKRFLGFALPFTNPVRLGGKLKKHPSNTQKYPSKYTPSKNTESTGPSG